jgi:hypothetical protein
MKQRISDIALYLLLAGLALVIVYVVVFARIGGAIAQ